MFRYARQTILSRIGMTGQKRLAQKKVAVIGLGGTGGLIAELLVRLGIGTLTLVDRDYVSLDNLHRQLLYKESDIGKLKIDVAYALLTQINSDVIIKKVYGELNASNVEEVVSSVDLVIDGTDNFITRFIINDACVKLNKPWIYTAAIMYYGTVMPIIPDKTACFRCLLRDPPAHEQTCSEVGVLNTVPSLVASIAVTEAIKILLGEKLGSEMHYIDLWQGTFDKITVLRNKTCPACGKRKFEFLTKKYYTIKGGC